VGEHADAATAERVAAAAAAGVGAVVGVRSAAEDRSGVLGRVGGGVVLEGGG
jgi:hypothetical protein